MAATKLTKTRGGSLNYSRSLRPIKPKEEWRVKVRDYKLFHSNYSCDVLLIVESNHTLCSATRVIAEEGEESTAVKFITPASLIKFLLTTCSTRPEYDYFTVFDEAYTELLEEYTNNNGLSPESLVYLIKLRILAYNEIIAHDRELIKELKFSLEQEMKNMSEQTQKGDSKGAAKRVERKSRTVSMKQNSMDYKYLQAKAGKIPNFVEIRKIPTIYNTDYDEPDPENIYYVLSGIYDPALIATLQKCNIAILSLIELGMEGVKFNSEEMVNGDNLDEKEFDQMYLMHGFWKSLSQEKTDIPKISKNTCYIKYKIQDPNTQAPSFDNFLILLKSISDFKRLYYHYFTTVRYLDVTETSKPISLTAMNNYNGFLDQIPNECITIPLMLHALLDEVCVRVDNWTNEQLEELRKKNKVKRKYHGGPVVQIKSLLKEYDCSHKKTPPIMKMPKAVKISYGNTLEYMNAHVPINKYIDTVELTLNELKKTLPLKLFQKIDVRNTFDIMFYNYVFTKWSEELTNVSVEELTLCVYAYLFTRGNFRKFNKPTLLSECMKVNNIQECMFGVTKIYNEFHKVLHVKLNTSFLKRTSSVQGDQVPNVKSVKKEVEEDENINKSCDNLSQQYNTLAQELDPASFIQMINVAYSNYNHFDFKYFAPTDVILLRFHYTNDKCGFTKKREQFFLRTPLCFRDFCYKLLLQDSEWVLREEKDYWNEVYINREKEKEYLLQHPKVDNYYDPKEFIIPGSIKFQEMSKTRTSTGRKSIARSVASGKKKSTAESKTSFAVKKSLRKSRESNYSIKHPDSNANRMKHSIAIPTCDSYEPTKTYAFEIYNLGFNFYPLEFDETLYHSIISVKLRKQQLPRKPLECTFVVSSEDVNIILHCEHDGMFQPIKPLLFNVNMTNGIVMVFSVPTPPIFHIENRHIVVHKVSSDENNKKASIRSSIISKVSKSSGGSDEADVDPKISELRNEVLQYLSIAMKEQLPVFKIMSSRLHKYQYVKRIKSKIVLPVGNIYRRVCCKPILYKRLPKNNQNIYEAKCVPYSDLISKERSPIDWKWNCSVPTGLSMETVQGNVPNDFYVRQRYVIERRDLPSIQDEAYRCYLRCGIIMKFLKDGSIKTLSPDKTLSHYKYGYFSSNKHRVSKDNIMKDVRLKRQTNVIPLHAYKKNLTALERQVRKISKKYKRHLIDIADNYRFERSRADSRKMHKIYKLSKRIYTKDSHVIPLINNSVITSEGRFIDVKNNIVHDTYRKYEETRNRDYLLNETVTRREDGTSWMIDKNGNSITQFPDGSRIKTWYTVLDENLMLGPDLVEYQKRVISVVEESESLTKFCQTGEEYEANEEEEIEVLYNKEPTKETTSNSGFVLLGMNYSFEHPNYATVSYYCWEDSSADILMPDKIQVTAFAEGTYKLKLINDEILNVRTEDFEFIVNNPETNKPESCSINLSLFNMDKPKPEKPFLAVKENGEKVFIISCDGQILNKKVYTPNTSTTDTINSVCADRMFVMKRDLSGMEMIKEPIPYKFVHTLVDLKDIMSRKNHENVVIGPTKIKIFKPLRKTYSEHLMMMYNVPILATTKERSCLDKLWKLHDLDINTIVVKRSPIIIYERYICCLPSDVILEQLAQSVLKCIIEGNENLPNINMIQDLVKSEESIKKSEVAIEKVCPKKYIPKHLTYKKQMERFKTLTKNDTIPKYFETVRGLMFLAVEECSEGAMDESSARRGPQAAAAIKKNNEKLRPSRAIRSSQTKTEYEKIQEIEAKLDKMELEQEKMPKQSKTFAPEKSSQKLVQHDSVMSNTYQTKLNIPEHLAIHLKPNAQVHEIILTANGLQIITDKNLENNYSYAATQQPNESREKIIETKIEDEVSHDEPGPSNAYPKYNSSYFGEDISSYFVSAVKIPSWDDSLCQKACINSYSTTTNTLVTIPEKKANDDTCKADTCACSIESIQRLAKCCQCNKYYCNCKDTYSAFATCALQNELKVSEGICVLATKIIQTIDKDTAKFNLLNTKLENVIRDTAIAWAIPEPTTNDLIKTLRWIIDNKIKKQNTIPEERALNIIKQIEASISKIKISSRTVTLTISNLQKMADLVLKLVCNSKNNTNITKEIRKLLRDAKINRLDITDTLKLAKEKIHLYYEHGLYPDLPIPEIPPESKCCKITQYIDYILDSMLERTCDKCNSYSISTNTTIHNTSPVNYSSKASLEQQQKKITHASLTKKQSQHLNQTQTQTNEFIAKSKIPEAHYTDGLHVNSYVKPYIIVEPHNLPNRDTKGNNDDEEDFDVSSAGGYSLVKSCEEIVDVSIPFINKKSTNINLDKHTKSANEAKIEQYQAGVVAEEGDPKYSLSKIKLSVAKVKEHDIITIMAPDQHPDSSLIHDEQPSALLSPLLLHHTHKNVNHKKPIVYDGNIISK